MRVCVCVCVMICKQANRSENETVCLANRESIGRPSMCCRYIGSDSVKVNFQQKMGENPVEIAHKFGAQKKGLMLTAAQLETAPPLLLL